MLELENHWFEDVFDAIHLFTWILDMRGVVIKANLAALKLSGIAEEDVIGNPIWSSAWRNLSRENRQTIKWMANQAMLAKAERKDIQINRHGHSSMVINLSFKPILDHTSAVQYIFVEGRDVTDDIRTTKALNQSEARFKTIFNEAGVGIVIKDISGKMLDCNPAFRSMLGYTTDEILQFDYLKITYQPDRRITRKLFNQLVSGKRKNYVIEKRYLHKDGHPIWTRMTASMVPGPDHDEQFVIAIVENIHNQKEIETELSELQRRLMHGREMERLRLAQDMHDGPLQELVDITFQLKELENTLMDEGNREQLISVKQGIAELARSIRMICGELRPPTLVPFGLETTIRSHANQFQEAHPDIKIHLDLEEDGQKLSGPIRIVLFRIYQAALNNILRHAQATQVKIQLRMDDGQATLKIKDNGIGFVMPDRWINLARQGHLGIVGARERAKEVGGDLDVITKPGRGTIIQAVVPFNEEYNLTYGEENQA